MTYGPRRPGRSTPAATSSTNVRPIAPESARAPAQARLVPFAYGFRPFFLLAGLYAIVPMATVAGVLRLGHWPLTSISVFAWHGHEMLFGFAAAAIAGFLLTAVPTWTNTRAVSGLPLAGLVAVWLAGRIVSWPWMQPSHVLIQALGVAFLPALAVTVAIPLVRTRNLRNLPFILLLAVLFLGDLAFHVRRYAWFEGWTPDGLRLAINTIVLMIVVIGGRITPAFTRNALRQLHREIRIRAQPAVDRASILAIVGVLLGDLFGLNAALSGLLAALAAGLLLIRFCGWGGWRTLDLPLLWVLHLGFVWLIAALALKALWLLGGFAWAMNWMHAFTAGTFGTMILGVMSRVALGHSGRALEVSRAVVIAYALVTVAALIRVGGPALAPEHYAELLTGAVMTWIAAFAIFVIVYTPILMRPRPDGRSG